MVVISGCVDVESYWRCREFSMASRFFPLTLALGPTKRNSTVRARAASMARFSGSKLFDWQVIVIEWRYRCFWDKRPAHGELLAVIVNDIYVPWCCQSIDGVASRFGRTGRFRWSGISIRYWLLLIIIYRLDNVISCRLWCGCAWFTRWLMLGMLRIVCLVSWHGATVMLWTTSFIRCQGTVSLVIRDLAQLVRIHHCVFCWQWFGGTGRLCFDFFKSVWYCACVFTLSQWWLLVVPAMLTSILTERVDWLERVGFGGLFSLQYFSVDSVVWLLAAYQNSFFFGVNLFLCRWGFCGIFTLSASR